MALFREQSGEPCTPDSRWNAPSSWEIMINVKIERIAWIGLALLVGCADGSGLDALWGSGGSGGAGGAPGGTDGSGGTTSTSAECNSGSDCPDPSNDCSLPTCIMNVCGLTNAPVGTPCGDAGGSTRAADHPNVWNTDGTSKVEPGYPPPEAMGN